MLQKLKNLVVEEEGQALTEYGLIIGLIAVVVITTIGLIGDQLLIFFNDILTELGGTPPTP